VWCWWHCRFELRKPTWNVERAWNVVTPNRHHHGVTMEIKAFDTALHELRPDRRPSRRVALSTAVVAENHAKHGSAALASCLIPSYLPEHTFVNASPDVFRLFYTR
jgi:hypothetical protein